MKPTRSLAALMLLLMLSLFRCGTSNGQLGGPMAEATPKPAAAASDDNRCVAALQALAAGKLAKWQSLTTHCGLSHAEQAIGPSTGDAGTGDLGGVPTPFRTYPATAAAPEGITVWFRDQKIVLVRLSHPVLTEALDTSLGAPEGKEPSRLASGHAQWIYASQGIVAHVFGSDTVKPFQLYAFQPMSVDDFRKSWIARLETRRIRQP